MKLPLLPQGFTAEFLGSLLRQPVSSVSVDAVGEGTGMMADMARLTLTYSDGSEPTSVIAKYSA